MEINNIFTESYDDPIIDDALDNEIDILSNDEATIVDYDEIPDYAAVSIDDDNRTVTIERFCEKFKNMVISAIEYNPYEYEWFELYNSGGTPVDIRNIADILDFVMWDGEYVTQSSDVNLNKLMSFKTIEEHVTFNVSICETRVSSNGVDTDWYRTNGTARPIINNSDDKQVNKIISIRDFKDLIYPESYFDIFECDPNEGCEPEWYCDAEDPDCDPHESY